MDYFLAVKIDIQFPLKATREYTNVLLCSQGMSVVKAVCLCQSLCLKVKFQKPINSCFQKWERVPKQIENISLNAISSAF